MISGWNFARFCIDLNCLSVSGISAARTTIVMQTIDMPQPIPVEWKALRIASKKSTSGWRTLAKTNTARSVTSLRDGPAAT